MDKLRLAGSMVFIGVAQFIILLIVAEAIYPDYSVSHNYISDLGNYKLAPSTPHAYIFNASIILMGLLLVGGGTLLWGRGKVDRTLSAFITLSGIGAAGVGVFPETSPYHLHTIFSLMVFLFASLASYPASLYRRGSSIAWPFLGTIGLIALGLFIAGYYMSLGWGGMERLIAYPNLIWAAGFSASLMTSKPARS
ncbi:MAG: DUF998 domain-containing protein [Acidilobus sp.]